MKCFVLESPKSEIPEKEHQGQQDLHQHKNQEKKKHDHDKQQNGQDPQHLEPLRPQEQQKEQNSRKAESQNNQNGKSSTIREEKLDPLTKSVIKITNFLNENAMSLDFNSTDACVRFYDLILTLAQKVPKINGANRAIKFESTVTKLADVIVSNVEKCIENIENGRWQVRADLFKTVQSQLREEMIYFSNLLWSNKKLHQQLHRLEHNCDGVLAILESTKLLSRASQIGENEVLNDSNQKRKIGDARHEMLLKAEKILWPFRERSPNLMGEILTRLGQIFLELLEDFDEAEEKYMGAKKMEDLLDSKEPLPGWCSEASAGLRKISEFRKTSGKSVRQILEELKTESKKGAKQFIEFILLTHPPKHLEAYKPEEWINPAKKIDKKLMLRLFKLYHTDRVWM